LSRRHQKNYYEKLYITDFYCYDITRIRVRNFVAQVSIVTKTHAGFIGRGCDRMVVGFTTTYAISAYHH